MSLFSFLQKNKAPKQVTPAEVETYYNEWNARYLESFGPIFQSKQGADNEALFAYYVQQMDLKPGMRLLDAGCGVAGPAVELAKRLPLHIDAITLSQTQVDYAQQWVAQQGQSQSIQVHKGDFHHMAQQFEHGAYDRVYFFESLVHSATPEKALAQAYALLKPDGCLYIKDLFRKTAYQPEDEPKIQYWIDHNNEHIKLHIIKKEALLMMLRDLGFQLEFCMLMRIPTNQDLGNAFVVVNGLMPEMAENMVTPYLEWYEIKAIKPGPNILDKM